MIGILIVSNKGPPPFSGEGGYNDLNQALLKGFLLLEKISQVSDVAQLPHPRDNFDIKCWRMKVLEENKY